MNIEHDDHDGYAKVGKTIYGETDKRRWSDRCRCGGTRGDHIRVDPEMLGRAGVSNVSNNNHDRQCTQFVPSNIPYFSNIKTVKENPDGESVEAEDGTIMRVKVEGGPGGQV